MSLRARLLLGLGVVAVVLVGAAVLVTRTTRADLVAKVDEQLVAAASALPGRLSPEGGGRPPGDQVTSDLWLQVRADGRVVSTLVPLDGSAPVLDDAEVDALLAEPGVGRTVPGEGADSYRVVAVDARGPGEVAVLAATSLDDVDASVARLVAVEAVATGATLGVLALVASWVLALGVRPLKRMTGAATAIAEGDLSVRVPDVDPRTEAGELGIALNRMLNRLEAAFAEQAASEARLRRFVADASHELRTPITTIRGYAELHQRGGLEDPDARRAALGRTEQEAIRMGALVEDLLLLARLDEGRPLDVAPVDLARVAADACTDLAVTRPEHPVRLVEGGASGGAVVLGDEHRLRQVVANVVGNAVQHTPDATPVAVSVTSSGPDAPVVVEVADEGPGMEPDLRDRAFERFARGDAARGRSQGSTGLGLSIVAAIVAAHGGEVSVRSAPGEGTVVSVAIPRNPGATAG